MGGKTAPLLILALLVLIFFMVTASMRYERRESKPMEALLGGVTPLLAGATTVGLVSASGLAFQSIVVATLFLVLAIAVDDVFVMLAVWHKTDRNAGIPKRIARTVEVTVLCLCGVRNSGLRLFHDCDIDHQLDLLWKRRLLDDFCTSGTQFS